MDLNKCNGKYAIDFIPVESYKKRFVLLVTLTITIP